jgi:serine/threonine protein kinase
MSAQVITREKVSAITNGTFVPITAVGCGKEGQVWYALPQKAVSEYINSQNTDKTEQKTQAVSVLRADLCAVKIHFEVGSSASANAIEALKCIQAAKPPIPGHFPRLLGSNIEKTSLSQSLLSDGTSCSYDWLAMTAVTGVDLLALSRSTKGIPIPEELIAHIAIQLHDALRWLHDQCKPAICHADLCGSNIMLNYTDLGPHSLPKVILVDFGSAKLKPSQAHVSWERGCMYDLHYRLAVQNQPCKGQHHEFNRAPAGCTHDSEWLEFIKVLYRGQSALYAGEFIRHAEFRSRFYAKLVKRRQNMKTEAFRAIQGLLGEALRGVITVTDDDILDAIQN